MNRKKRGTVCGAQQIARENIAYSRHRSEHAGNIRGVIENPDSPYYLYAAPNLRAKHLTGYCEAVAAAPHFLDQRGIWVFALWREGRSLLASGVQANLSVAGLEALEAEVRTFFADAAQAGVQLLVGALPFDRRDTPMLYQPRQVEWGAGDPDTTALAGRGASAGHPFGAPLHVAEEPSAAAYARMVEKALERIACAGKGGLRKVVLARGLRLELEREVDPLAVAARLALDRTVTVFALALGATESTQLPTLVGATPELLISRAGLGIVSHPLAGSAPRRRQQAEDRREAEALLRSDKDRREHALVVEAILDTLSPLCARLAAPRGMELRSTATMWHLGTRIEGVLKSADAPSAAGLAALLHPTPAVGGEPRALALETIAELEPGGRGFYAGAVGWTDAAGDGEWYVALRCAEIDGRRVLLRAGAGIVAGSDPQSEVAETAAKFRAMLEAIGVGERGEIVEPVS